LLAVVYWLAAGTVQPTGPAASAGAHIVHAAAATSPAPDTERTAIRSLADQISQGGLPGDQSLADALVATAAQPPGALRETSAEQTLALAQVLMNGGGISPDQYQDVVTTLAATGATAPTTTTTTTTTSPAPSLFGPLGGHGFHHGHGDGQGYGDQG
jgi:hypothetical protein